VAVFPPIDPLSVAIYVALAGVIFVATLQRPSNAFVALIATAPFDFSHAIGPTTITFNKVALLATIVALALRRPNVRIPRGIGIAILAVVAVTLLTISVAEYRGPVIRETLKWIQYLLIYSVCAAAWYLDPDRRRLQITVALTVSVVCILALVQELTGSTSGIWLNEWPFVKAYPRIAGPLEGPNQLAGYIGIALPFLAVWALERTSWLTLAAAVLSGATLVLTISRAGIGCAIIALIIVFAFRRGSLRAPVLAALVTGVLIAGVVFASWHASPGRFFSLDEPLGYGAVGTRRALWHAAYTLWTQHPLLGVGAGNYELILPAIEPNLRTHANSWYLQSLAEGGVILLLATCALVWASIATFRRELNDGLSLAAFAASIAFAAHGFVDYLVFYPKVAIMWFALLGISAVSARSLRQHYRSTAENIA
jgi:O-antigen ligase